MTELVTERFLPEVRGGGVHDATVMEQYIPHPGGEEDPYKDADMSLARKVRTYLLTRFPVGYEWCVRSDLRQGVVMISIPLLMGVKHWGVVNIRTTPIDDGVLRVAGEILERYRLSRSIFNVAALLEARQLHSKLVAPGRPIPT